MPPGSSYTPLGIATIYHTPSTGSGAHSHHCNPLTSPENGHTIIVETVSAYTDDNRLVISSNIKNLGSGIMESVTIDEITVGDMVITQLANTEDGAIANGHGTLTLSGRDGAGNSVTGVDDASDNGGTANTAVSNGVAVNTATNVFNIFDGATAADGADPATVTATVLVTGLSTDESDLASLTAGISKSFRIVVTGISTGGFADVLDILRTVPA